MRKVLRKKEIKSLAEYLNETVLTDKARVELVKDQKDEFIFIKKPLLFKFNEGWIYTLHSILEKFNVKKYPKIKVDKGAIKFIANGADIMRPGIIEIDSNVEKDKVVLIIEETYNKPLAIGIALFDYSDMNEKETGKVIKTIHFVGDDIWNKEI